MNTFGRVFLGHYSDHKVSSTDDLSWKTSENVKWTYEHLWSSVDKNGENLDDTYINRIIKEVLKSTERTTNDCLFIIAIVDLMFDPTVQTTILSSELITKHMIEKNEQQELESQRETNES